MAVSWCEMTGYECEMKILQVQNDGLPALQVWNENVGDLQVWIDLSQVRLQVWNGELLQVWNRQLQV